MNELRPANWSRRSIVQGLAASALAQNAPNRPVRIGIAGGRFGATFQWHLHPQAKVTAVCDIRPEALQRQELRMAGGPQRPKAGRVRICGNHSGQRRFAGRKGSLAVASERLRGAACPRLDTPMRLRIERRAENAIKCGGWAGACDAQSGKVGAQLRAGSADAGA